MPQHTSIRVRGLQQDPDPAMITPLQKLNADLLKAARLLTPEEVRYYTARYYQIQEERKRAANQIKVSYSRGNPVHVLRQENEADGINELLKFDLQQSMTHERTIHLAMQAYAEDKEPGRWLLSHYGVGPVIASGLLAHIDITRAPYSGHLWSFAGLNTGQRWLARSETDAWVKATFPGTTPLTVDATFLAAETFHRRQETLLRDATMDFKTGAQKTLTRATLAAALARRPWNAAFKRLLWLFSDCAKKFSNRHTHDNLYGMLYKRYKAIAIAKNLHGDFAVLAAQTLRDRKVVAPDSLAAYTAGRFPDGRVDYWALRAVQKIFLSHIHHVIYECHYGMPPPVPYILAHDPRHTHYIPPPHWPLDVERAPEIDEEDEGDVVDEEEDIDEEEGEEGEESRNP